MQSIDASLVASTLLPLAVALLRATTDASKLSVEPETSVGDDDISESAKLSGDSNESLAYGNSLFSSELLLSSSSPKMQSIA